MKTDNFIKILSPVKKELPNFKAGDEVKVFQKTKEGDKEKIQSFEGLIIARSHGKEFGATITVRKIISGVGVEKIFPIYSPAIDKIEVVRRNRVRRAKLYYMRSAKGRKAKLKEETAKTKTEEKK